MHMNQKLMLLVKLAVICVNALENIHKELHLDLQTDITINETVIMKCSGEKSIESWYFFKGNNLLIDDGSVNSDYSLDKIHTNHTMHSMYIEFKEFSQNYLDVYKCVREKGATSNSLDLKEVFKNEPEVKCENVSVPREDSVNLQCTITFPGINCGDNMNIYWENGNTGEKIYTSEGQYKEVCEDGLNDTFITASLYIPTVTDDVSPTRYFIVLVHRNKTSKHCVAISNHDVVSVVESLYGGWLIIEVFAGALVICIVIVICIIFKINQIHNRCCSGNNNGTTKNENVNNSFLEESTAMNQEERKTLAETI